MAGKPVLVDVPTLRAAGIPTYLIYLIQQLSARANRPMLKGDPGPPGTPGRVRCMAQFRPAGNAMKTMTAGVLAALSPLRLLRGALALTTVGVT